MRGRHGRVRNGSATLQDSWEACADHCHQHREGAWDACVELEEVRIDAYPAQPMAPAYAIKGFREMEDTLCEERRRIPVGWGRMAFASPAVAWASSQNHTEYEPEPYRIRARTIFETSFRPCPNPRRLGDEPACLRAGTRERGTTMHEFLEEVNHGDTWDALLLLDGPTPEELTACEPREGGE